MENNILKRKLVDNRLLYTPIVVPDILKDCLLILAHDKQGHNRFRRTYPSLKNRYHWKALKKSVHQHCMNCQVCTKHNIKTQQLNKEAVWLYAELFLGMCDHQSVEVFYESGRVNYVERIFD